MGLGVAERNLVSGQIVDLVLSGAAPDGHP